MSACHSCAPCSIHALHISPSLHSALPTRIRLLTHLLPLPETVMGLVKLLPGGNVVLAVKTREVGHAVAPY